MTDPNAWRTCVHQFQRYFGPVMLCQRCGAQTMVSADPRESKPIHPPHRTEIEPTGKNDTP